MDTKINIYILSIFLKVQNFFDNFDSNIGVQRFVITEKFAFEVDDLRKRRRKRAAMMAHGDAMSLAYRRHEY